MPRLAIAYHLGYPDRFRETSSYLDNVLNCGHEVDLYVTHQTECEEFRRLYPQARYIQTLRGLDTGAFLLIIKAMIDSGRKYDYVFKIHTKGEEKARIKLLQPVAGDIPRVQEIIHTFETSPSMGLVGAKDAQLYYSQDLYNRNVTGQYGYRLKLTLHEDSCFVAGTIFWTRWSILQRFVTDCNLDLQAEYNLCELGYSCGYPVETATHAWERLFGYIVAHYRYKFQGY